MHATPVEVCGRTCSGNTLRLPNAASINTARSQPASLTRRVSNVVRMDVLGLRHTSRGSGSQPITLVPCTPRLQNCIPVRVAPCNGRDGGNGPDRKHVADKVPVQPERQSPIRQTEHCESPATGVRHHCGSSAQPVRISCWRGIAARIPVLYHLLAGKVACTYQTTAQIAHTFASETCRAPWSTHSNTGGGVVLPRTRHRPHEPNLTRKHDARNHEVATDAGPHAREVVQRANCGRDSWRRIQRRRERCQRCGERHGHVNRGIGHGCCFGKPRTAPAQPRRAAKLQWICVNLVAFAGSWRVMLMLASITTHHHFQKLRKLSTTHHVKSLMGFRRAPRKTRCFCAFRGSPAAPKVLRPSALPCPYRFTLVYLCAG